MLEQTRLKGASTVLAYIASTERRMSFLLRTVYMSFARNATQKMYRLCRRYRDDGDVDVGCSERQIRDANMGDGQEAYIGVEMSHKIGDGRNVHVERTSLQTTFMCTVKCSSSLHCIEGRC